MREAEDHYWQLVTEDLPKITEGLFRRPTMGALAKAWLVETKETMVALAALFAVSTAVGVGLFVGIWCAWAVLKAAWIG